MTNITVITARLLEAADTDDRLPRAKLRPSKNLGFWPAYEHSFADLRDMGEARRQEEQAAWYGRRSPPSASAIQRHAEVLEWTGSILTDPEHRKLVWAWAFCEVRNRSFASWCRATNRERRTAACRRARAFDILAAHFRTSDTYVALPDVFWLFQVQPETGTNSHTMATGGEELKSPRSWADPEHPTFDTLTTEDAVAEFDKFLAKTNKRRRRAIEREAA